MCISGRGLQYNYCNFWKVPGKSEGDMSTKFEGDVHKFEGDVHIFEGDFVNNGTIRWSRVATLIARAVARNSLRKIRMDVHIDKFCARRCNSTSCVVRASQA